METSTDILLFVLLLFSLFIGLSTLDPGRLALSVIDVVAFALMTLDGWHTVIMFY